MLNLILFGPPGSGKGTQSKNIIKKYGVTHLSTGDLLRNEIASGSDLGKKISQMIDSGNYVTDNMAIEMVENFINKNDIQKGFIFDGFPRTVKQAAWLDDFLEKKGSKVHIMVSLEVNDTEVEKRLTQRGQDLGRPDDQDIDIIKNRIHIYHTQTKPVITYYKNAEKHQPINGMGTMDEVFNRICEAITLKNKNA